MRQLRGCYYRDSLPTDPEACVPLLVLEHWLTDLRVTVRGLDGQVLREWTGRIQEQADGDGMLPHSHNAMHDARVTERQHIRGSHFVCTYQSANVSLGKKPIGRFES